MKGQNKINLKSKQKTKAIYPGTFDPITNGHIDLINRALSIFDEVIILIAHSSKNPIFSVKERKDLILKSLKNDPRITVDSVEGLLAEYAQKSEVNVILRGLRAISDFEYEFQMATMNKRLYPKLETFFLMASENNFFVNSTLVKEVISHGGDVSSLVPSHVEKALKEKLC
ncbi:MAG: pantetheine-phosphate adenylyltransferase [Deltaproteobacteria bacterium]|nr:pantetheine-phosphate adenylyltransferase [Deltaproteobacteria bacterium]